MEDMVSVPEDVWKVNAPAGVADPPGAIDASAGSVPEPRIVTNPGVTGEPLGIIPVE
jgi:hypothetical protein